MAGETSDTTTSSPARHDAASLGEVIDSVKLYARQETVGPLKGAGRWIAMGAVGAICLGTGLSLLLLGMLRMFQTEAWWSQSDHMTWLNYLIVIVVTAVLLGLAMWRINQKYLNKEDKP